jgi:alginate O-acetyltransferase complex protein AlgI
MLFNSIPFLIFFPIVVILYFNLPQRFRNIFLLLASCFFYMFAIPKYILILFFIITVDYFAGIQIEKSQGPSRILWLRLSLIANIGLLFLFKGFPFGLAHFFNLDDSPIFWVKILLPIGLSFHTFQAMSYTIEVYRGNQKAERNFITYAIYVMFFPQLVAGPIERPYNLIHQFGENHIFQYENVVNGMRLMLWGMFKKVVVADSLAVVVDQVYGDIFLYKGWIFIVATVFFAFQIFYDFSGYSDIAIGAARVLGFRLMTNFRNPYASASFSEFWKRWHISLSSWFRDYLYIPLGGNRVPKDRHYLNLFITFLIAGVWHGCNTTFLVWGGLNGFYVIFAQWTKDAREKLSSLVGLNRLPNFHRLLKIATVFSLTCFGWIFFRASSNSDAICVITRMWGSAQRWDGSNFQPLYLSDMGWNPYFSIAIVILIIFTQAILYLQKDLPIGEFLNSKPTWLRWTFYYLLTVLIALAWLLSSFKPQQFIYFQF